MLNMTRIVNGEKQYLIDNGEMFCGECDEMMDTRIAVDAFMGEDGAPDWEETIGEAFCAHCESEELYESEREAVEVARENYEADRADAMRKGEW